MFVYVKHMIECCGSYKRPLFHTSEAES